MAGEYSPEEVAKLMSHEQAQNEAVTVRNNKIDAQRLFIDAHERALKQSGLSAEDIDWHKGELEAIKNATDADLLELSSTYMDQVRAADSKRYELEVDLAVKTDRLLEDTGGKEPALMLLSGLHEEADRVGQTNVRLLRAAIKPEADYSIPPAAIVGEAIGNMMRMTPYKKVPGFAWGSLFGVGIAESNLGIYMASKKPRQ